MQVLKHTLLLLTLFLVCESYSMGQNANYTCPTYPLADDFGNVCGIGALNLGNRTDSVIHSTVTGIVERHVGSDRFFFNVHGAGPGQVVGGSSLVTEFRNAFDNSGCGQGVALICRSGAGSSPIAQQLALPGRNVVGFSDLVSFSENYDRLTIGLIDADRYRVLRTDAKLLKEVMQNRPNKIFAPPSCNSIRNFGVSSSTSIDDLRQVFPGYGVVEVRHGRGTTYYPASGWGVPHTRLNNVSTSSLGSPVGFMSNTGLAGSRLASLGRASGAITFVLDAGFYIEVSRHHPEGYIGAARDIYIEPMNPFARRASWGDLYNKGGPPNDALLSKDLGNGRSVHFRNPINVAGEAIKDFWNGTLQYLDTASKGLSLDPSMEYMAPGF